MDKIFKLISKSKVNKLEKYLTKYPDRIEVLNEYGATPLLFALESFKRTCAITLLKHGANPDVSSSVDELTPLDYAEKWKDIELINLINKEEIRLPVTFTGRALLDKEKEELNSTLFGTYCNISKESDRVNEALDTILEGLSQCLKVLQENEKNMEEVEELEEEEAKKDTTK